jgi:hypothetical protein
MPSRSLCPLCIAMCVVKASLNCVSPASNFWFARNPSRIDAKRGDHFLQVDFPLLIRTFFQLSVAGSGLGGVVHARQSLAQYRLRSETDWEVMAQYGKGCALSQQTLALIDKYGAGNRQLIIRLSRNVCWSQAGLQHARCTAKPRGRHIVPMRLTNTPLWLYFRSVRSSEKSVKL